MKSSDYINHVIDGWQIISYSPDTDSFLCRKDGFQNHIMTREYAEERFPKQKKIGTVHPDEEAAKEYYARYGVTTATSNTWTINAGDSVNSYFDTTTGFKLNELQSGTTTKYDCYGQEAVDQLKKMTEFKVPTKTPTPIKMTRLTTYENWTILLRDNKLVAVNEKGETVEAIGSLLSAGGKAWMWKGGQLWSGVLERTLTEKQEQEAEKEEKVLNVYKKYNKQLEKLEDKQEALVRKRDEELRSL